MKLARFRRTAAVTAAAATAAGLGALIAPAASAATPDVSIANTKPAWLAHAQKRDTALSASAKQTVRVYLAPKGGLAALKAEVAALTDPASADYGKFLTTAQYEAAYEPTDASVKTVGDFLSSSDLKVGAVEANHRYVEATGTRKQLNKAFGVTLAPYRHDGQDVVANATAVTLPAEVGSAVLTVKGLDTTRTANTHSEDVDPPAAFVNARPCSQSYGQVPATYQADYRTKLPKFKGDTLAYAPCGYTGPQFRAAYEGNSTNTGKGVTVAITDAYAWQLFQSDANTYAKAHGDGAYVSGQLTQSPPPPFDNEDLCDPSGWSGEEMLDIEAVHAMAPDARIRYYGAANCLDDGLLDALGKVVDENKATFVTNSWGDTEGNTNGGAIPAYEQIFLQGAAQGQSFLYSSGDNGDELANTAIKQADYPTSDPYVTSVGGTSTGIGADGAISFQTGWGTEKYSLSADGKSWEPNGYLYGAGGGASSLFNQPSYQKGVTGSAARTVPDIAFDADPTTGMLVGQTQAFATTGKVTYGEYRIGGTSLASPLAAGFLALASQKAGGRFGLLNPMLYGSKTTTDVVAAGPKGAVRVDYSNGENADDGLLYSVRTFNQDSSLRTTKGYDQVTGLGVPKASLVK